MAGFVEPESTPAERGDGAEEVRVRQGLGSVGCGGSLPCRFEEVFTESYELLALQQEMINSFDLFTQVTQRRIYLSETVQVCI